MSTLQAILTAIPVVSCIVVLFFFQSFVGKRRRAFLSSILFFLTAALMWHEQGLFPYKHPHELLSFIVAIAWSTCAVGYVIVAAYIVAGYGLTRPESADFLRTIDIDLGNEKNK